MTPEVELSPALSTADRHDEGRAHLRAYAFREPARRGSFHSGLMT
jgi:hypothetical protein